ncbi:hypothetical protein BRE01_55940 [Brevibacillus reuszeri]|uniref:Permease n=1 Tax=Brevibacillus reuszeri TaxID=54915 RepID=A0A0K9Z2R1_9BACL|nr:ABC-2 transporter permease [Brevibacillus reuszeri]KNB74755.1 hypothetical protein ADS79_00020 [Brevibacillus reuszeri]MED1859608.1 ABC-2 transporter permease [Brevibacillus reuszeri]GED71892.1 hypothetical protein BRE01_55940 [Brevibacillus reuszeri]
MYNLLMKDLKVGINRINFVLPFLLGALMLIPGWIYFIVVMYFFWVTAPNMFVQFRVQNDLLFTTLMPVAKKDMVKARMSVFLILEVLYIVIAMIYSLFTIRLFPNVDYLFFAPHLGFWGLCFAMFAIYNLLLFPMFYKTAYKYGPAQFAAITAAMIFAGVAQWLGIQSPYVFDLFNGSGANNAALQTSILGLGIVIFIAFTWIAYRISVKRFLQVEIQ